MLLDLTDELFNVDCEMFNDNGIEIRVGRNTTFKWEDISDVMIRLNNYLISSGVEITISYIDYRLVLSSKLVGDYILITNNKKYQNKKYRSSYNAKERIILKLNNNTLCDHFTHYYDKKYHQLIIYIDFDISDVIKDLYQKPI